MSLQQLYLALLIGGFVLLASIVATRVATRVGLPSLLLFLGVGVILGEDGLGLDFDELPARRDLGTAALAIILVEGGLTTRFADIRKVLAPAAALATIGVVISMVVTAAGAHLLLGMDWQLALLLGAIVSSTDAAAVFSVLRVCRLPRRVAGLLEAESGFNDAPAVILVLMFSVVPLICPPEHALAELVYELLVGSAIGLGCGFLGSFALRRIALPGLRALPDRDIRAGHGRVRRGRQRPCQRVPRRVSGRGRARQLRTAPPLGDPVLRRRARLARADRPVRPPRPAGRPQRTRPRRGARDRHRAGACCWSPGRCRSWYPSPVFGCPGANRCSCRGPACGARSRSCWRPSRSSPACPTAPTAQHRVHPGGGVHPGSGAQPAPARPPAGADSARMPRARSRWRRPPSTYWTPNC